MKQNFSDMRVTVIGAGETGLALVRFLVERGASVTLSDQRSAKRIAGLDRLREIPVQLDLGGHSEIHFTEADLIAVSPGVPLEIEPLRLARNRGIPLLGEIELASRECTAPLIAVTGTNGKSTTVSLLGEALRAWGKQTFVGGNLGTPLVEACGKTWDYLVVELSSFQLETVETFSPDYALLLNLSEDHLDRYPDLASYFGAKQRLFAKMSANQVAVLNADDPQVMSLARDCICRKVLFSGSGGLNEGLGREGDELLWRWQGEEVRLPLKPFRLQGAHNVENAMAALIPPLLEGCPAELAWRAICNFHGLEHRMQLVRELDEVRWYNDSKGTNVGSVIKSLSGLPAPVTLIAGGKDKGGDYRPLRGVLENRVEELILLGEAAPRMEQELSGLCRIHRAADLATAVIQAQQVTKAGGTVLLSPACSSFDMFENYARRGEEFTRLVEQLESRGLG